MLPFDVKEGRILEHNCGHTEGPFLCCREAKLSADGEEFEVRFSPCFETLVAAGFVTHQAQKGLEVTLQQATAQLVYSLSQQHGATISGAGGSTSRMEREGRGRRNLTQVFQTSIAS